MKIHTFALPGSQVTPSQKYHQSGTTFNFPDCDPNIIQQTKNIEDSFRNVSSTAKSVKCHIYTMWVNQLKIARVAAGTTPQKSCVFLIFFG